MKYNFDKIVDRRGSGSYKWDSTKDSEMIPLWVADMDFQTAPCVVEALRKRVEHGIFGYTHVQPDYYIALKHWFETRHGYRINIDNVIYTSGVVPAISAIIKAMTKPGDGVIVQTPVYNCFFSSIRNNGCRIIENKLLRRNLDGGLFTYDIDFRALEQLAAEPENKLLLLCNPHNPAGRLWIRPELEKISEICRRNQVQVVSDEIHCELTMPSLEYVPYGRIDDSAIVCLSPSKAFNTAGLQIANIVCPNTDVRRLVDRAININEVCDVNPFGVVGLMASYTEEGANWLDELRAYLKTNYELVRQWRNACIPQCGLTQLEATYLPWIDVKPLGISGTELEEVLKEKAHVWVNAGGMYGDDNFIRLNIACPRKRLEEGLNRIAKVLANWT
ncbi:MAG: pyridoxal phosphate-dependent aminotransferase [Muribaculum sp.]|nr:pyridoxal phosphate-dependent aminotransferase [Muribaculaceae bacterium]MCM1080541.1 pyridoxal phosphate-dependent aminotransferase [Muribaculum sp.]